MDRNVLRVASSQAARDLGKVLPFLETNVQLRDKHLNGASGLPEHALKRLQETLFALLECLRQDEQLPETLSGCYVNRLVAGESAARALLVESPALCAQLMTLTALAVRWPASDTGLYSWQHLLASCSTAEAGTSTSSQAGPTIGQLIQLLALTAISILDLLLREGPLAQSCSLACTLLRMHTLEACSRSLDTAVGRLGTPEARNAAGTGGHAAHHLGAQGAGTAGAASSAANGGLLLPVQRCAVVLLGLSYLASRFVDEPGVADPGAPAAEAGTAARSSSSSTTTTTTTTAPAAAARPSAHQRNAMALLREALRRSGAVEHLARGLLHLMRVEEASSPLGTWLGCSAEALVMMDNFIGGYARLSLWLDSPLGCSTTRDAVLGGPCARYLAAVGGLHVLCEADGGPSYGMLAMIPAFGLRSWWSNGRSEEEDGGDGSDEYDWLGDPATPVRNTPLFALAYAVDHRPPKSLKALEVLRRLVDFAVAAAQQRQSGMGAAGPSGSGGGSGGSGGSGGGGGGRLRSPGLPLMPRERSAVAALALTLYRRRVPLLQEQRRQAAEAEWWQLAFAAVRHTITWAGNDDIQLFAKALYIDPGALPSDGTLPAQPPPALAAALSAGLLPCLERLVRGAGGGPSVSPGAANERLLGCLLSMALNKPLFAWLLAYGSPTEAAALISSMGKLMRAAMAEELLGTLATAKSVGALLGVATHTMAVTLMLLCVWMMDAYACSNATKGGPAAQLRRMAVLAACEWLPGLSDVVIGTARRVMPAGPGGISAVRVHGADTTRLRMCIYACTLWLPVGLGSGDTAGGAGPSTSTAAATGGTGGGGGLGGRRLRLLVREARVVELLGAGMRLEAHMSSFSVTPPDERPLVQQITERLLSASGTFMIRSPLEVRKALAVGADPGPPVPAACTWSSGVVLRLLTRGSVMGPVMAQALREWERGGRGVLKDLLDGPTAPGARAVGGCGLVEVMEEEVQQPSPLRRCSWWRCTNLAGDSEAGLQLMKCGRCSGAWYCRRECQAAHWREGHKGECGTTG